MLKHVFAFRRPRKRVLFAWELGGGLGHVHRLLPIAIELHNRGFDVVFALRQSELGAEITRLLPQARIVPTPYHIADEVTGKRGPAFHYADVLYRCGYDSADHLGPLVVGWLNLIRSSDPALVVCDHSPTVVLAAAGRTPVVHLGSGFATPPAGLPFIALHPGSSKGANERERQVVGSIKEVHERLGTPSVNRVYDLLGLAQNLACCLPELDPYRSVRPEPSLGPVQTPPAPRAIKEGASLFGYLNGDDPRTARIIESLAKAGIPCGLYVRKCPPEWAQVVVGSTVMLHPSPQKTPDAVANALAIVHHGGLATSEIALALGRPQFIFPRNLEQALSAGAIEDLKCGANLADHGNPGDAIRRALNRGVYRQEAAAVAARIASRPVVDVRAGIVETCLKHLARA